jgi:hypothetical protein
MRYREFATALTDVGLLGQIKELVGFATGKPEFTDNASVNVVPVGPARPNGSRPQLMAMSETPTASYILDPDTLQTLRQVSRARRGGRLAGGGLFRQGRAVRAGGRAGGRGTRLVSMASHHPTPSLGRAALRCAQRRGLRHPCCRVLQQLVAAAGGLARRRSPTVTG